METASDVLIWRPLIATDLPLLARWLRDPQVARWWNHENTEEALERDFGASVRGEEPGEDRIVSLNGHPVGLVQRSLIGDYPDELAEFSAIAEAPDGAVQLDYLIGDAARRGCGLGSRIIAMAVDRTWLDYPTAPAVMVAVVAANTASWRALEKAGLQRIGKGPMEPDNPIDDSLHYVYRVDRPTRALSGTSR
ncbi:MAG: GNAT family N-acetyltransferase [Ornithinimicrobium sp.]